MRWQTELKFLHKHAFQKQFRSCSLGLNVGINAEMSRNHQAQIDQLQHCDHTNQHAQLGFIPKPSDLFYNVRELKGRGR